MKICKVCKQENEDSFIYCKNCGTLLVNDKKDESKENFYSNKKEPLKRSGNTYVVNDTPKAFDLVPVYMNLPDIENPYKRTLQQVYVTKQQYEAMKKANMFSDSEK